MLLRICLVYAWFTLVYGPPCLSVNHLVYCKCFFLRIAVYFTLYIYIYKYIGYWYGEYAVGIRSVNAGIQCFPFENHFQPMIAGKNYM